MTRIRMPIGRSRIWSPNLLAAASLALLSGCLLGAPPAPSTPQVGDSLAVTVLYPTSATSREMGQTLGVVVQVSDSTGSLVGDARTSLTLVDSRGHVVEEATLEAGPGPAYRNNGLRIPHRNLAGPWRLEVAAQHGSRFGQARVTFTVRNSTSEDLLERYGFWLDAPTLRGIVPQIVAERGDAENGMVRWGGSLPGQHVLPENWIDVHWRRGEFPLAGVSQVRRFLLDELGHPGPAPIRELGPFVAVRFKDWEAWKVEVRSQFRQIGQEWVVFYAPEAYRTYALGTTIVVPPAGIDAHQVLRDSFAILNTHAIGVAPEPLPHLRPAPELVSPAMGAAFVGAEAKIALAWVGERPLVPDEYFEVRVDWNDREANPFRVFASRDMRLILPASLLQVPNCGVFNWQVRLMRQTGKSESGQALGEALSYPSLYRYLLWSPAEGESQSNRAACPNAQY